MTDPDRPHTSPARALAWVLLVCCAAGNVLVSLRAASLAVHAGLGVVSLACIAALVAPYLRHSR